MQGRAALKVPVDEGKRDIPSLDGLRAVSVVAVVLSHAQSPLLLFPFNSYIRNGRQGVAVFFVLSGFLITHLLIKERDRRGSIDLKLFYVRRSFRIFPPFYAFLAVIGLLAEFHQVAVTKMHLLIAATYTWNYAHGASAWSLGHLWSLAIEEQFYLLWPACMAFFDKKAATRIAIAILVLSPVVRAVTFFAAPSLRSHILIYLHTQADPLMAGCLLALALDGELFKIFFAFAKNSWVCLLAILTLAADTHFGRSPLYTLIFSGSVRSIAISIIVIYSVFRYSSPWGRILNWYPVRHLGMISYSLYLWQQPFTGAATGSLALCFLKILIVAEFSYWCIERPSFTARSWFTKRFWIGNSIPRTLQHHEIAIHRVGQG